MYVCGQAPGVLPAGTEHETPQLSELPGSWHRTHLLLFIHPIDVLLKLSIPTYDIDSLCNVLYGSKQIHYVWGGHNFFSFTKL